MQGLLHPQFTSLEIQGGGELGDERSKAKIIKIQLTGASWFYFQNEQHQEMQSIHVTILRKAQRI